MLSSTYVLLCAQLAQPTHQAALHPTLGCAPGRGFHETKPTDCPPPSFSFLLHHHTTTPTSKNVDSNTGSSHVHHELITKDKYPPLYYTRRTSLTKLINSFPLHVDWSVVPTPGVRSSSCCFSALGASAVSSNGLHAAPKPPKTSKVPSKPRKPHARYFSSVPSCCLRRQRSPLP